MPSSPTFEVDSKRDATDSIRGYVYQAYQSVLAWMQLKENEILALEGAEDFDVHCGSEVKATQVKDVASNLTLRSEAVIDTINNFWKCCERNPEFNIFLRFLTTAEAGQEQGTPFGAGNKGLEYWNNAQTDDAAVKLIREFLLTLKLTQTLKSFLQNATDYELLQKLIVPIRWDLGCRPMDGLQYSIEDKLKTHGIKVGVNSHYSCQALPNLLKKVADLLSTKGTKELRYGDFLSCFDEATTLSIPRGQLESMVSGSGLQQLASKFDLAEVARSTSFSSTIGAPVPIVDGGIPRENLVESFVKILLGQRVLFLSGSSGTGKTNIASLVAGKISEDWGWIGMRGMLPMQVKDILMRTTFSLNLGLISPFLVLDDLDLSRSSNFEREFISLVSTVVNSNGLLVITGPNQPQLHLLPKIWVDDTSIVAIPYFDKNEVAEMVSAHGLSNQDRVLSWAKTIWLTTSGHPQLVHARIRALSAKGWPEIEFSDLTKPPDVHRVKTEARARLVEDFPNENARVLAYRLSLFNGGFTRETAISVAESPPPISLPGEIFDELIGPWVERFGDNRYRISPLLSGAANDVLTKGEINKIHEATALSIISRKGLDQFEVSAAFFHAFMAKSPQALTVLSGMIVTAQTENSHLLYDAMSWFTLVSLEENQTILPDNPSVELILRLAQYKLLSSSPEPNKAIPIIEKVEKTLSLIDPADLRLNSEALAYGTILNTIEVHIPSHIVIRMMSRVIDLIEEDNLLSDISGTFIEKYEDIPGFSNNDAAQLLFSYQGVRISGLADLCELVDSLDALPATKRDHLLEICSNDVDTGLDFASLLVSRAWWKEIEGGQLNVDKALNVLEHVLSKSREWSVPEITKACFVAMSVILDEYDHSYERAMGILNDAEKQFTDDVRIINQRAKVLFHANLHSEALEVARKALDMDGWSSVEYVFCCRDSGIAAANIDDWKQAGQLFLKGAEKAQSSNVQQGMSVGLKADAAFALWKQNKLEDSLLLFADTLDLLGNIEVSEDIRTHHLHATIRHCVAWIHFDIQDQHSHELVEPRPGMCSNQDPHEGIKDHQIVSLNATWDLLSMVEQKAGLNVGIKGRSQSVTKGEKSLLLEGYSRTMEFDGLFEKKDFENLIPKLISMLEAVNYSKRVDEEGGDGWSIVDIPKLPDHYWENAENYTLVYHSVLTACVICTVDNQAEMLPIESWRSDLQRVCKSIPNEINQFLNVLEGAPPNETLYQSAAAAIHELNAGTLDPVSLWKSSFYLLNAYLNNMRWVEEAMYGLLMKNWYFAISNQRFAFSNPSVVCPKIEEIITNASLDKFSAIASILIIAMPHLNILVQENAKQMLEKASNSD